jgi:hypothetical protein
MYYNNNQTLVDPFFKVFIDKFAFAIGSISNSKRLNVILYVLRNIDSNNKYTGTTKIVSKGSGVSERTVKETFAVMQEKNVMKKIKSGGAYMINPALIVKGRDTQKAKLILHYNTLGESEGEPNNILGESEPVEPIIKSKSFFDDDWD